MIVRHFQEEGEPRPCPFCNEPAAKERSFYTMFSKFIYWCDNQHCRLGRSKIKFWFTEWQGVDKNGEAKIEADKVLPDDPSLEQSKQVSL